MSVCPYGFPRDKVHVFEPINFKPHIHIYGDREHTWLNFQKNPVKFYPQRGQKLVKIVKNFGFRKIKSMFMNQSISNLTYTFMGIWSTPD